MFALIDIAAMRPYLLCREMVVLLEQRLARRTKTNAKPVGATSGRPLVLTHEHLRGRGDPSPTNVKYSFHCIGQEIACNLLVSRRLLCLTACLHT